MKSFVTALVITAAIVAGSLFYSMHIDDLSQEMEKSNQEIMELLHAGDFEQAEERVQALSDFVDEKKIALATTMDHSELDRIEMNLSELRGYVEGGMKTDALARCEVLDVLFRHLPKNYKLKLENIL